MTLEEIRDAKNVLQAQLSICIALHKELEYKEKDFLDSPQGVIDRVVDKLAAQMGIEICYEKPSCDLYGYYIWRRPDSSYLLANMKWHHNCRDGWMKTREEVNQRVMKYYLANS